MATTKSTHRRTRKAHHNSHARKHGRQKAIKREAEQLFYHTLGEVKDQSETINAIVTDYVKEQPFKSLGIALAAGAVLALLFRR